MSNNKNSSRAAAFLVDVVVSFLIILLLSKVLSVETYILSRYLIVMLLFRDIFGKSLGKFLLGITIVDFRTGKKANIWQRLLRQLTLPIIAAEMIVVISTKDKRRLGDYWAKTDLKVVGDNSLNLR